MEIETIMRHMVLPPTSDACQCPQVLNEKPLEVVDLLGQSGKGVITVRDAHIICVERKLAALSEVQEALV
jgi:hypothetical protein